MENSNPKRSPSAGEWTVNVSDGGSPVVVGLKRTFANLLDIADRNDLNDPRLSHLTFGRIRIAFHLTLALFVSPESGEEPGKLYQDLPDRTFGEKVVRTEFNPSSNDAVAQVKNAFAHLIDQVNAEGTRDRSLARSAISELEIAAMLLVKLLTAPPVE